MEEEYADKSIHKDARIMLKKAKDDGIETVFDRSDNQGSRCKFCRQGLACQICSMGPCRIIEGRQDRGVCGADADIMVSRNLGRMIAAGAAAHSDHGRDLVELAEKIAKNETDVFSIASSEKLKKLFLELAEINKNGKFKDYDLENTDDKIMLEVIAEEFLDEYGIKKGNISYVNRAPQQRIDLWENVGVSPRGIDREIVEMMHRGHMGVDNVAASILAHAARVSLSDGWGGSMIATELSDVIFGVPEPTKSTTNLGVLKEGHVNVVVHGHNPIVSEKIIEASRDTELVARANHHGAEGINVVGICCTGNEVLMRQGAPIAGNLLMSELAIITGAVDAMCVDYQCIMPSLGKIADCYQTKFISTNEKAKFPGAEHLEFDMNNAYEKAKEVINISIDSYVERIESGIKVTIPDEPVEMMTGFSNEAILNALGGSLDPLIDVIKSGAVKGVVGIVGCNNPKVQHDYMHTNLIRECIERDILVLVTGCSTVAAGKEGYMMPEGAEKAGEGLKAVCNQLGIPPVLHVGSCVDNSRILQLCGLLAKELGVDIADLPVAASAPEWMSEKALSIGLYAVSSGIETVLNIDTYLTGSENVAKFLTEDLEQVFGAAFKFGDDPYQMAEIIENRINDKRQALGLDVAPMAAD